MIQTGITIYRALREIVIKVYHILKLHRYETPKGRTEIIHNVDALTLALFKQSQGIATKKSLFEIIAPRCSYKTLNNETQSCAYFEHPQSSAVLVFLGQTQN